MRLHTLLYTVCCCTALTGCVLPPKAAVHPTPLTAQAVGLAGPPAAAVAPDWWQDFGDPQLDRLMSAAMHDNPTLALAQARVAAALSQSDAARAERRPSARLTANEVYGRAPNDYVVPPPIAGHTFFLGQAGAALSWELDFWGRQAAAIQRSQALAGSARADLASARLMIAGAVLQAYVDLYRSYALADIAEQSAAQRSHIIDLTRRRVGAGLDTQLELHQAEGQLPQARVARDQARAAVDVATHRLAALAGIGTGRDTDAGAPLAREPLQRPSLNIDAALPVPTELPIDLLARRPDVVSAHDQVDAADADRRAARAAFYPRIDLSGLAGIGAFGLGNLVDWSARGFDAGPLISLPLYDGGRLKAQYGGSEARLDAAIANYDDTVLGAVREAADQISGLAALARERTEQATTLEADEAAYRLAEERYRAGLAGYLAVLYAQTQVLAARQGMIDIVASQAVTRVTLLLAIGGSFDSERDLTTGAVR